MPRLFTALEIPGELVPKLEMLRGRLAGARWIDPENYHLTLRFIGDVEAPDADDFVEALSEIWVEPFSLKLSGVGSFGGRKPRALWVGVEECEPLMRLQRANERAARQAGLPPETRNFSPHVTLARLRGAEQGAVANYLSAVGAFEAEPFPVDQFVLMSAREGSGGGPYVVEERFPLVSPSARKRA
ncbi:RNA 2',3'-cyclic phosphodiesterase [Dichotomicrobium thermohalophilum]|uniref:RNA 2',3'-cyclic phosphodiesterase n=1 Tax=Dichotomicrobium thermohalophilum TaxID=933063 RepID=A0A397Q2Y3_9HYPH|nr:RNA 2',3'-cyclic phosphodiesterase [Dichotomicrobium thermohalophilum]RIA55492.1 2'-5' RNA ligase [Dichotomicrobium thermohalophilum]